MSLTITEDVRHFFDFVSLQTAYDWHLSSPATMYHHLRPEVTNDKFECVVSSYQLLTNDPASFSVCHRIPCASRLVDCSIRAVVIVELVFINWRCCNKHDPGVVSLDRIVGDDGLQILLEGLDWNVLLA